MAKSKAPKRTKTKHQNIYFNEQTKKYDVKFNYKVYNPLTQKNEYKAKWVYGIATIAQAQDEWGKLRTQLRSNGGILQEDKPITLQGAYDLWETKMIANNSSPVTINNTKQHLRMISQFIPLNTQLKNITQDTYLDFCAKIRTYGYSEETLHSLNATFRKLINLAYKNELIQKNILNYVDNMRTGQKDSDSYRLIDKKEFDLLDEYFANNSFVRLGVNNYPKYRLLLNILYYTGMRIGEVQALTYGDFEEFSYYRKGDNPPLRLGPSSNDTKGKHLQGMRIKVTKAYVSDIKLTKSPKNFKKRTIPLCGALERLADYAIKGHLQSGGSLDDKIFDWGHGASNAMIKKACEKVGIPTCSCHDFRHTFISNLIRLGVPLPVIEKASGDTQATILKRYSHMFESDEVMIIDAIKEF